MEYQGTTNYLSYSAVEGADPAPVYGSTEMFGPSNITINHRGYLYAKETGNYTFSAPNVDDIVLLWVGQNAYNNYTRDDATIDQDYIAKDQPAKTYTVDLTQVTYTPIRLMFANAQGKGNYDFSIEAPDGSYIISPNTTESSPYLVQYSCDRHQHQGSQRLAMMDRAVKRLPPKLNRMSVKVEHEAEKSVIPFVEMCLKSWWGYQTALPKYHEGGAGQTYHQCYDVAKVAWEST